MVSIGLAKELPSGPDSVQDLETREYTRRFLVETNDKNDGPATVMNAPGIPGRLFPYQTNNEIDLFSLLREKRARRLDNQFLFWEVECVYRTADPTQPDDEEDPLLQDPEIEFGFVNRRVAAGGVLQKNVVGATPGVFSGILGTFADEPFDPQPEIDEAVPILLVTRNESVFNLQLAVEYQNAVNSDIFLGASPRQAKVAGIRARWMKRQRENDIQRYRRVSYEIHFNRETWDLSLLSQGTYYYENGFAAGDIKHFEADGHPIVGLLAADGDKLAQGGTPLFQDFRVLQERPFTLLNLPLDLNVF